MPETEIWTRPPGFVYVGGRVAQETKKWPLLPPLSRKKLPLHPPPEPGVPPCVSLEPFELLPQCWSSERVSPSESVCGPFKRNAWDFKNPLSHSATIPTGFYSQKVLGLLFSAPRPWAGPWLPSFLGALLFYIF